MISDDLRGAHYLVMGHFGMGPSVLFEGGGDVEFQLPGILSVTPGASVGWGPGEKWHWSAQVWAGYPFRIRHHSDGWLETRGGMRTNAEGKAEHHIEGYDVPMPGYWIIQPEVGYMNTTSIGTHAAPNKYPRFSLFGAGLRVSHRVSGMARYRDAKTAVTGTGHTAKHFSIYARFYPKVSGEGLADTMAYGGGINFEFFGNVAFFIDLAASTGKTGNDATFGLFGFSTGTTAATPF